MPTHELAIATLILLLTPGPTNTLMLLSGADRGFRATLRLIPLALAAYLFSVVALFLLANFATQFLNTLRPIIALISSLWVLVLALRLWRRTYKIKNTPLVTRREIITTTLLNPKALIFGLVLLPGTMPYISIPLFAGLVIIAALVWTALGSYSPLRHSAGLPLTLRRGAACWLAILSIGIIIKSFS
ncbi:MAG: hypothetical protein IT544_01285 [Rhodobacteraceae bacterium]|nr:hypothetical protein [Paracoccaceae bacterium]